MIGFFSFKKGLIVKFRFFEVGLAEALHHLLCVFMALIVARVDCLIKYSFCLMITLPDVFLGSFELCHLFFVPFLYLLELSQVFFWADPSCLSFFFKGCGLSVSLAIESQLPLFQRTGDGF